MSDFVKGITFHYWLGFLVIFELKHLRSKHQVEMFIEPSHLGCLLALSRTDSNCMRVCIRQTKEKQDEVIKMRCIQRASRTYTNKIVAHHPSYELFLPVFEQERAIIPAHWSIFLQVTSFVSSAVEELLIIENRWLARIRVKTNQIKSPWGSILCGIRPRDRSAESGLGGCRFYKWALREPECTTPEYKQTESLDTSSLYRWALNFNFGNIQSRTSFTSRVKCANEWMSDKAHCIHSSRRITFVYTSPQTKGGCGWSHIEGRKKKFFVNGRTS